MNRRNPLEVPDPGSAPTIYDSLRVASPHRRKRAWEKAHQGQKVAYRGVDPKVGLQVKATAGRLHVPEGEVARALIEHALHAYAEGDLNLDPRPDPLRMRMTLFPSSGGTTGIPVTKRPQKSTAVQAAWRVVTTWRGFPPELKQEISALASRDGLDVPIGELVSALLRYGLKAYDIGLLKLEPVGKATARTLTPRGTV